MQQCVVMGWKGPVYNKVRSIPVSVHLHHPSLNQHHAQAVEVPCDVTLDMSSPWILPFLLKVPTISVQK